MITKGASPSPTVGRGRVRFKCTCLAQTRPDFLVIDATNVLSRAYADSKRWKHVNGHSLEACFLDWLTFLQEAAAPSYATFAVFDNPAGPSLKQSIDPAYLQRRRLRQAKKSGPSQAQPSRAGVATPHNKLVPLTRAADATGVFTLVAQGGLEADDVIGAACHYIADECPESSIIIASGDSDMQQHLTESISWMHILPFPTTATPSGVTTMSSKDFQEKFGFPAQVYPEYLAMMGKKDASVSGIGVGATTASKLFSTYGTIEGVLAAAQRGQLKSWGVKVQSMFQEGSPELYRLRRNRALFVGSASENTTDSTGAVLSPSQRTVLSKAVVSANVSQRQQGDQEEEGRHAALAWSHPLHAGRWRHAGPHAQRLATALFNATGEMYPVHATSESGLPVDILLKLKGGTQAVMVCCECDFEGSLEEIEMEVLKGESLQGEEVLRDLLSETYTSSKGVVSKLNGAMRHHLTLLRKAGLKPRCIPWWNIPH